MNLNRLILFFIFCSISLLANIVEVNSLDKATNILPSVQVYVDKENKHDFDFILKNSDSLFETNKKTLLYLGYSSDAIWLKFSIHNNTNEKITKVLEISNQMLDQIELYTKEGSSYKTDKLGVLYNRVFDENILKFYLNLSLKPQETKAYYLKVSSLSCAVYFEANLMNKDELYKKEISHQLVLALFFGSIATLILYNLFVYFFTRELAYLYYVLYLFFTGWNHLSYNTMGRYFLPASFTKIDTFLAIYYLSFISIFALLFTRKFLQVANYKKFDFILKLFLGTSVLLMLMTSRDFYPIDIVGIFSIFSLVYIVMLSFYLFYKGVKNARFFVIGWSIALLGWIMLATYNYGYWSLITSYPYFYELAIFTEAILFSIALANKLNTTKELERSVATNTILTRELHHRVKNNMQFIISIYRLKLAKYNDKNISNSLKEVEGTIQAMSATHEMLYAQKEVSRLDTQEYFSTLIERLKTSYECSQITIDLKIEANLNIDTAIYIGIIVNELLTNSLKYAFKDASGAIKISLTQEGQKYKLLVEDNGIGFDVTKESDTFGLELVKTLVEEELKGYFIINADNGVSCNIIF